MEQDGQVNATPFHVHIPAEQPDHKGIRPLHHISMEQAEQEGLEDICKEKWHGLCGVP